MDHSDVTPEVVKSKLIAYVRRRKVNHHTILLMRVWICIITSYRNTLFDKRISSTQSLMISISYCEGSYYRIEVQKHTNK